MIPVIGLAAQVAGSDTVQRLIPKVRAGTVWVNCHGFVEDRKSVV